MEQQWERMYREALAAAKPRKLSETMDAGWVGAAVLSAGGNLYTGVCIDTACSLGLCAERSALAAMFTAGEYAPRRVCAVSADGRVLPPCGACREFMTQMGEGAGETEILLDREGRTARLRELVPEPWSGGRE